MTKYTKPATADLEALHRIFTVPENENTTLGAIEKEISKNLMGFLKQHIVAKDTNPADLERDFRDHRIPEEPTYVSQQAEFLLSKVVAQSVHVSSPSFVGHMTSALPNFMLPLSKLMIALNQNLVKIETSKAFTPLERQVIGMLHHLVYEREDDYYQKHIQSTRVALGAFCSDGTIANITALWVALNKAFPATKDFTGVGEEGLFSALTAYQKKRCTILVSERGHYSLAKAANLIGIGKKNIIPIPTTVEQKVCLPALEAALRKENQGDGRVIAVVGIAGTTETGSIDPLLELARLCKHHGVHYHVDAAWGGPTLFSKRYRHTLKGIELADSVTFDAHKQLYTPIGSAVALFRNERDLNLVEHTANYVIRRGSRDLGRKTLEGSRPGTALLVHSSLKIIGQKGFEILIDLGIDKAREFAALIEAQPDFEVITQPELNILTYRYIPEDVRSRQHHSDPTEYEKLHQHVNRLVVTIQKEQRDQGRTFVSRTTLTPKKCRGLTTNVFRVVLANPLTTIDILSEMLIEQRAIAQESMAGRKPTSLKEIG